MNTISIMILAAELLDNFRAFTRIVGIIGSIAGVGAMMIGMAPWTEWSWDTATVKQHRLDMRAAYKRYGAMAFKVCGAMLVISLAIPSSRAIYMVAASEIGETVVTSPEAKEMLNDLKSVIRKKLKEELGDDVKA